MSDTPMTDALDALLVDSVRFLPAGVTAVITVPMMITETEAEEIKARFRNVTELPVLILSGGMTLEMLPPPEPPDSGE